MSPKTMDDALLDRIRTARALPSPPIVTARLVELADDPTVGINEIIAVLKTDPALAARLLRLANSPLYARRRRTDNLRQAVMLLGVDAVLTASLSLTLLQDRGGSGPISPAFKKRRWMRSVHSAVSAQTLAAQTRTVAPSDAFLAGLLQDIGVQVVLRLEPDAYSALDPACSHDELVRAEIEQFGTDHAVIGAELLEAWKLPPHVVEAVRWSHTLGAAEASDLSTVISIAGLVADGVGGEPGATATAAASADELLDIGDAAFVAALDEFADALPHLAIILEAEAPDPDVLAELAHEVIVTRQLKAQSVAAELHDQLTTLTTIAEELKAENRLDALTGLANRRALDQALSREFDLARENGFPLSVLFVDLDDFKRVNDRYGHGVGDELLTQAARRLSATVRDGDLVGRYGGEEFLVVLPGADVASSDAAARRIVEQFNSRPFDLGPDVSIPITTSVGASSFDHRRPHTDVGRLVHAADVALYMAKDAGKNRWARVTCDDADRPSAEHLSSESPAAAPVGPLS